MTLEAEEGVETPTVHTHGFGCKPRSRKRPSSEVFSTIDDHSEEVEDGDENDDVVSSGSEYIPEAHNKRQRLESNATRHGKL
jgi:hypothetical protein